MATIVVVDDHPLIRRGLAGFLEEELDFSILGQFDSAEAALEGVEELAPDLIITEVSLPGED